jgi:TonB family protein
MKKIFTGILFLSCFCVFGLAQDSQNKTGSGNGNGKGNGTTVNLTPIRILAKSPALYTDAARQNNEQGLVTLRVMFLASGELGAISVVSGLAYGLTEQAITAAKAIKFEPAKKNGQPITTIKTVVFSFVIYATKDEIKKEAVILAQPKPEYPQGENFSKVRGTVKLKVVLTSFGKIMIISVRSDLPKEFKDKASEAAAKIKYEPALYKNDGKASVKREIEYEFTPN